MLLSVISPVYKAEAIVAKLVSELHKELQALGLDYEILLVEDASPDASWQAIEQACAQSPRVRGIKLSRNFGQHYAITAGLAEARGDVLVVMDCDLQDRPDQIALLYNKLQEGYDLVFARRVLRNDSLLKRLSSRAFYSLFGYLTDTKQDSSVANFGLYKRKAIEAILSMRDSIRYFPTMSQWVGFRKAYQDVEHGEREEGESSYSWARLFDLAFNNIIAFSDKPLRLTVRLGLFMALVSGLVGLFYILIYFLGYISVSGFASLIISLWFLSGIIIFILGMLGIYLGKTFDQVKQRPLYIIDKRVNFD